MRAQFLRWFILLLLVAVVASLSLALVGSVTAASPEALPPAIDSMAQAGGVILEKQASAESVPLGQVMTYTITVKNESGRTLSPELVDELPQGLSLLTEMIRGRQTTSISATVGQAQAVERMISWSGTLADGQEARIIYPAIPPSTAAAGQSLQNTATLTFGETTLEAAATIRTEPPDLGLWGRFVNSLAWVLVTVNQSLSGLGVPYAFGFAIILFTVAVRAATFPLNMQQIKSAKAMQELQPKLKALQDKYKDDRDKLAKAQMDLYREHGVNPLGGCLPLLVQMPIWFALYQSLLQLSLEGLLNEGFFWIPSLAGPVSTNSAGFPPPWLYPFIDGAPPVGWGSAIAYLILPILLIVSQIYMQQMMSPPATDPQQASMQSMMKFMPLMFGYFALIVPSGLTLYWFTSNILALVQQYFTKSQTSEPATAKAGSSGIPSISDTPVPANSAPNGSTSAVPGEGEKDKNGPKRKKSRKRSKR